MNFPTEHEQTSFASYVIDNYGGGIGIPIPDNKSFEAECERLEKLCESEDPTKSKRIYLLEYSGDIITSKSPKSLKLKSEAYINAGSTCRRKAIESLVEYFKGDRWDSDLPNDFLGPTSRQDAIHSALWVNLADCYYGEKEYEHSETCFQNAITLNPDLTNYLKFSEFYSRIKQYDKAISLLQSALARSPLPSYLSSIDETSILKDQIKTYENRKENYLLKQSKKSKQPDK